MTNNMVVTLKSSTTEMDLNSPESSTYIIPELEGLTSLPSIRSSIGVNAGADGGWTSEQLFDARLISMRLVIANEDISIVESTRRQLNSLLAQGRKEELLLSVTTEGGSTYEVNVRTSSVTSSMNTVLKRQEFLIQFRADDPLIYGSSGGGGIEAILRVQQNMGGFEIPFTFPLAIGGGDSGTLVQNIGSELVYPTITMYGDLHSPKVINRTTNQQMQILADIFDRIEWSTPQVANGNYLNVTNPADKPAPVASFQLNGLSSQTTTTGKNLMPMSAADLNGENESDRMASFYLAIPAGTYTVSFDLISSTPGTNGSFGLAMQIFGTDTTQHIVDVILLTITSSTTPGHYTKTFTLPEAGMTARQDNIRIGVTAWNNGARASIENIQIEAGSTPTAYEPFTNGASPNPSYPQTIQTVTGEQDVVITGKNLFDNTKPTNMVALTSSTAQAISTGVRVTTVSSGTYKTCGWIIGKSSDFLNKTISLSAVKTPSTGNEGYGYIGLCDAKGGNRAAKAFIGNSVGLGTASYTHTTEVESSPYICVVLYGSYNISVSAGAHVDYTNLQLEIGQPTDYEPFGASYTLNLGKNLLNLNATVPSVPASASQTHDANSMIITATGTSGAQYGSVTLAKMDAAATYTLTGIAKKIVKGTDGMPRLSVRWRGSNDGGTTWTAYTDLAQVSNPTEGTDYPFRGSFSGYSLYTILFYNNTSTPVTIGEKSTYYHLQLELGETASTFTPYIAPIELCKIGSYTDYIYKSGDTWKINKRIGKVVLDGTESWGFNANNAMFRYAQADAALFDQNLTSPVLSNFYRPASFSQLYNSQVDYGVGVHYSSHWIAIRNKDMATVEDFKDWLSKHPTTVYYGLDTTQFVTITDNTIINQLEAITAGKLAEGDNTIIIVPTPGELSGTTRFRYYTTYVEDVDEIVIDSHLKTVTLNGANAYELVAPGSEFIDITPGDNIMVLESDQTSDNGYAEVKFKQGYLSI